MAEARPSRALLGLTIFAAPAALGVETLLRRLLFPIIAPDFEIIREFFGPALTTTAYGIAVLIALAAVGGAVVQGRLSDTRLSALPEGADDSLRFRTAMAVFLLTSSIPQVPTILSTFAYMFGASLTPVLVGIGLCSVGVVGQAMRVGALADRAAVPRQL